jgi:L-lactate dehydrogenase complex protein LldF
VSLARAPSFHRDAARFLGDPETVGWHDATLHELREKRDRAACQVPDWEALREHARAIKAHVIDNLPALVGEFAARARDAGFVVHFAADAEELCATVAGILEARGARRAVKSKSMLTEECGLNRFLALRGIEVVDTDLGERIVQLRKEPPSHFVVPAIHIRRSEIGELFHRELGTPEGETDPERLTLAMRRDLRRRFLEAEAGITGANFAVAETGSIIICTNEGNADLGTALPSTHIACFGVDKLIPRLEDAAVFLRLLARSATGQPITAYTTHLTGPDPSRPGHEAHLVIADSGRSALLRDPEHRHALTCIRCGACLNTCPVYRRVGGHCYGVTIPGPIGAVLAPAMQGTHETRELVFASSLCGSCTHVCPSKIDLTAELLAWRRRLQAEAPLAHRLASRIARWLLARPRLYALVGKIVRSFWPLLKRRWPGNPLGGWIEARELPPAPKHAFRDLWQRSAHG